MLVAGTVATLDSVPVGAFDAPAPPHPAPAAPGIMGARPSSRERPALISCVLHYRIDPYKLAEFEAYARMWLPLVERFGGTHRGYLLPSEGASDVAIATFDFDSLAAYESYRTDSLADPDCIAAYAFAETTRCIVSYERTFMRPLRIDDAVPTPARATGTDDAVPADAEAAGEGDADVIDLDERREP